MLATYTTLVNNVVSTAIQEAATREQIDATRQMIDAETKALNILQYQLDKGYASGADYAAQKSASGRRQRIAAAADQAAGPVARPACRADRPLPGQMPPSTLRLADLTLPADLPVSLPGDLVAQRPDILQAQADLHAASAGSASPSPTGCPTSPSAARSGIPRWLGDLFTPGTDFWSIGADWRRRSSGGTLLYQERAARGTYDQAAAQFAAPC